MKYTKEFFDAYQERRGTQCIKWDSCNSKFGIDPSVEMVPMWIADMDFRSPVEVSEAIQAKAAFGCSFGYTLKDDTFYDTVCSWVERRYHWHVEKEWVVFSPGVIPGFNIAIQSLTKPGDGVMVMQPVYYPFTEAIVNNHRVIVNNALVDKDGYWSIDFEDFEAKAKDPRTTLLILCSPHNPVGRIWDKEDLVRLSKICSDNGVIMLTDELHADLVMGDKPFTAVNAAAPEYLQNTITYYAPSKTFNLAGLQTAFAIIPNKEMRDIYVAQQNANRIIHVNSFGAAAMEAAWTKCDSYVDALCSYVRANMDYMSAFLQERLPMLKMRIPEATYMVWVDFRGTGMTTEEIEAFIVQEAHIGVDMGTWFGPGGEGYLRFNLACPRCLVEKAMAQLEAALKARLNPA